jgi:DNA-binding IscR family transcriptional regulator
MQCIKPGSARCEVEPVCPSRVGLQAVNVAVQKALEDVSLADIAMPVPAIRAPAQPLSSGYPSATKADQHRGSP